MPDNTGPRRGVFPRDGVVSTVAPDHRPRPGTAGHSCSTRADGRDLRQSLLRVCRRFAEMDVSTTTWIVTLVALGVLLLGDLFVIARRPHEPSMKESFAWVAFYVGMAVL